MTEVEPYVVEGEIVEPCTLNYGGCTGWGVETEDVYESDVNNNPGVMVVGCENCMTELALDI